MWDEENLYIAAKVWDDTPFVYREGFPLDELDAIILFFSTNPNADPNRTAYEATDWRIVQSTDEYDFFNYVDREMIADNLGWETQGEYGDELVFDDYEAVTVRDKEMGGYILESKIPLHNLSNDKIAQLVPAAGMTVGFDFSILDVDLPCPGIHSLRMQYSAQLDGRDRKPYDAQRGRGPQPVGDDDVRGRVTDSPVFSEEEQAMKLKKIRCAAADGCAGNYVADDQCLCRQAREAQRR